MPFKLSLTSVTFTALRRGLKVDLISCKEVILSYGPREKETDESDDADLSFRPRVIQHFVYNPFSWVSYAQLKVSAGEIVYRVYYPVPVVILSCLIGITLLYAPFYITVILAIKLIWHVSYLVACQQALFRKMLSPTDQNSYITNASEVSDSASS